MAKFCSSSLEHVTVAASESFERLLLIYRSTLLVVDSSVLSYPGIDFVFL